MTQRKIYKQQQIGIFVVGASLIIVLLTDAWTNGWSGVNWIGLSIVSGLATIAFLKVRFYGDIVVDEKKLEYWNWFFQKETVVIERVSEIDWSGIWFRVLHAKTVEQNGKVTKRRINTGAMAKKDVRALVEELVKQNPQIRIASSEITKW